MPLEDTGPLLAIRARLLAAEALLAPRATREASSQGRRTPEPADPLRLEFQRDRDRIIHTRAFRRLKHKTQVFVAPDSDHVVTRMTHTIEVQQIARSIARALGLNEDLTEATRFGHDLGTRRLATPETPSPSSSRRASPIMNSRSASSTRSGSAASLNLTHETARASSALEDARTVAAEAWGTVPRRRPDRQAADSIATNHDFRRDSRRSLRHDLPAEVAHTLGQNH
jgi:dGTPase